MQAGDIIDKLIELSIHGKFTLETFLAQSFSKKEPRTYAEKRIKRLFTDFIKCIDAANAKDFVFVLNSKIKNSAPSSGHLSNLLERAAIKPNLINATCWLLLAAPAHPSFRCIVKSLSERPKLPDYIITLIQRACLQVTDTCF